MQDAVRYIQDQFIIITGFKNPGISLGGIGRNDYLSEDMSFGNSGFIFGKIEGQHVGGAISGQELAI
jgi:hypothetical protein